MGQTQQIHPDFYTQKYEVHEEKEADRGKERDFVQEYFTASILYAFNENVSCN